MSHPESIELYDWDPTEYGQVLYSACSGLFDSVVNPDIEVIKEHVKKGRYTFLFDRDGEFIMKQSIPFP